MDWLRRWFRGNTGNREPAPSDEQDALYAPNPELQKKLDDGCAARDAFYATLGAVDDDVLAPFINPWFMDGPRWPSLRQAWRVIRKPASIIIASDGLSDPFDDDMTPLGFKVEVCAEAPGTLADIDNSWLFGLVHGVSQMVADHGGVHEALQKYRSLSTVVDVTGVPENFRNPDGRVGVLIGVPATAIPAEIELPDGKVKLLVVKLLHPSELAFIEAAEDRESARNTLIERFLAMPEAHLSTFHRASVA